MGKGLETVRKKKGGESVVSPRTKKILKALLILYLAGAFAGFLRDTFRRDPDIIPEVKASCLFEYETMALKGDVILRKRFNIVADVYLLNPNNGKPLDFRNADVKVYLVFHTDPQLYIRLKSAYLLGVCKREATGHYRLETQFTAEEITLNPWGSSDTYSDMSSDQIVAFLWAVEKGDEYCRIDLKIRLWPDKDNVIEVKGIPVKWNIVHH